MKWTQKKLSDGHQHCEEILQQRLEKSRLGDPAGNLARAMSQDHRCLAITGYMLDYDIDAFRKHLSASAKGQLELWNRKQNGEEIFHHFVNVGSYRYLFDALAAGDFRLATALARFMEGPVRNDFDNYIGFNLKYLVLEDYQRALAVAAQYSFDKWKVLGGRPVTTDVILQIAFTDEFTSEMTAAETNGWTRHEFQERGRKWRHLWLERAGRPADCLWSSCFVVGRTSK